MMYAWQGDRTADENHVFSGSDLDRFAQLYPSRFGPIAHNLHTHPVFRLDHLVEIADRIDPSHVECRTLRPGGAFAVGQNLQKQPGDAIRTIADARCWVMLRDVQRLPQFANVVDAVTQAVSATVEAATGPMQRLRAFIFISSPEMVTPLHFDAEYNVLFHLHGRKTFTAFPVSPAILTNAVQEDYYASGNNLLDASVLQDETGTVLTLSPGDACHVPFKSPHHVVVGDEVSVSLSVTWVSAASADHDEAWRCNTWLRRLNITPSAPLELPARSRVKALSYRALRRVGLAG